MPQARPVLRPTPRPAGCSSSARAGTNPIGGKPGQPPQTRFSAGLLEAAYEHFKLDKQGNLVSPSTLTYYDWAVRPFLRWLREEGISCFEELEVDSIRLYRAGLAEAIGHHGRRFEPRSLQDIHKAMLTFFRWAEEEGYPVDGRLTRLKRPKAPEKEPTIYHIKQLREILAACSPERPVEELMIKILVGSGVRESELCGLAVEGPDGLPDLMTDSISSGRAELRVRWDGGAKGKKSRRVPITPKLAAAIKRYEARFRPPTGTALLLNKFGLPFRRYGIVSFMDRLQVRVGFRVHAHAFRHTFATVATKMGWNFEHLRAAMGHADYKILQTYVRLATERDLGRRQDWADLIASNPALDRW